MKIPVLILILFTPILVFSQGVISTQLETIEKAIESNSMDGFTKLDVDLDNDGDLDYIYLYQCAEPKCIEVYLNVNQKLEKVLSEFCYDYYLHNNLLKKDLIVKLNHCCGESPFTSVRSFNFGKDVIKLNENYVIFNDSYELLEPDYFLDTPYYVTTINEKYNVRFSPNIREYTEDEAMLITCEGNTNIIAKLKQGSTSKVISELIKEDRTWLFVEVSSKHLYIDKCNNPIDYNFEEQKLRGWISGGFVEKI